MPRSPALPVPKSALETSTEPASYEAALAELDGLVAQMEAGQMPLEGLLDGYRRASELMAFCKRRLQAVEAQVKVFEEGQLKDWTSS